MAKRYYDERKDSSYGRTDDYYRENRSSGDDRSARRGYADQMEEGSYAGEQARRTQEMEDAGMIREDRNAVANLPQNVMYKPYPKNYDYLPEDLDDTIRGIDVQIKELDGRKRDRGFNPKKV